MTRRYGRAAKGARVVGSVPVNRGPNVTIVGTMDLEGMVTVTSLEGAINGTKFRNFVEETLAPTLVAGDVVVMDNLPAHKVKGIAEAIQGRGARLVYLPPILRIFRPLNCVGPK